MIQLAAPIALVATLTGVTHSLLRAGWLAKRSRKAAATRRYLDEEEVQSLVAEFGHSSNSFMTLYPGFEYFAHPNEKIRGMIAFVETPDAWVGGAEPFCAPEDRESFLRAFAAAAQDIGKRAMMLPVDEANAELASRAGYGVIMIGSEPTWALENFPRTGNTWSDVVPTAKTLAAKRSQGLGSRSLEAFPQERAELERMTQEWLGTRKMDALSFLNQVDPWFRQPDKRYFKVQLQERTLAYLAAIPIHARKSWYLIDLIRRSDTPAGSTELLLLQAMRILRESGALEVTMGVAPLSGLENAAQYACAKAKEHPLTYQLLRAVYEHGHAFYNFKPLHQYKLKFAPTSTPPAFLIYTPKLGIRGILSLSRAFIPAGMARATWSGALRMVARFSLADWIRTQLTTHTVVRSVPPSWLRLLERCKLTVILLLANLGFYFWSSDSSGHINPSLESSWGFSWNSFLEEPLHSLILSPFLHWNLAHVCLNLLVLIAFTGGLEYLAGSGITAAAYFAPMLLSNPITAGTLAALKPWVTSFNPSEIDVGASLGIFGCAGALSIFLRWGRWLAIALCLGAILDAVISHAFLPLNHLVAIGLGWGVGRFMLQN